MRKILTEKRDRSTLEVGAAPGPAPHQEEATGPAQAMVSALTTMLDPVQARGMASISTTTTIVPVPAQGMGSALTTTTTIVQASDPTAVRALSSLMSAPAAPFP